MLQLAMAYQSIMLTSILIYQSSKENVLDGFPARVNAWFVLMLTNVKVFSHVKVVNKFHRQLCLMPSSNIV